LPYLLIGTNSDLVSQFPSLFFAMLGDADDYSEYKKKAGAGLKVCIQPDLVCLYIWRGGIEVPSLDCADAFHYNGQDTTIQSNPGIVMLMSWIPL
jgi:GPH family glycoside/pentoside/hexuronide:cation symporter